MSTLFYADQDTGAYLGGLSDDLNAPENSTLVDHAPAFASQIWNGTAWTGSYEGDKTDNTDGVAFQLLYHGAPWQLFALFPLLKFYGDVQASRQGAWAIIKSQNPAWLTQTWIDNMEAYCASNNMPLV